VFNTEEMQKEIPSQDDLWKLITRLFPICRSLTGHGVRQTFAILKEIIPLQVHEIPSGTAVFDWTIPNEWNIEDAYIKDPDGRRIVDFKKNNLHIVNYSIPFEGKLTLAELEPHLHSLPELPDAIPYVTSYYQPRWGFCLSHNERQKLRDDSLYEVKIDSSLKPGFLTYGDLLITGQSSDEILISTYICHPSLANNELSGPVVAASLAKILLQAKDLHYSYRFVFIPETIGSIAYIHAHLDELKRRVKAGYVVTCVGDPAPFSYLQSRAENTLTDRLTLHILKMSQEPFHLYSYLERGSDERQYSSPGVDLPIGSLMRSKYGTYPEYHTSLDNLNLVTRAALHGSLKKYLQCIEALEHNQTYVSVNYCEPQLGKRGLYPTLSTRDSAQATRLMMNFLAYCDAKHDLLAIAEKLNCSIFDLIPLASLLSSHKLIKNINTT
jgi:aminopeptidase-like protein